MTITSVDALIAAIIGPPQVIQKNIVTAQAAGTLHTPWYTSGITGIGSTPGGGLNGTALSGPQNGQIPTPTAVSGLTSRIARMALTQSLNLGHVWIVDRLWGNVPVVTTTTAQAITSPTFPARDTSASTNGAGVYLALEASLTTGNAAPITNTTVSYTNSSGTSGRTATLVSWPTGAVQGTWVLFALQAGDVGVKSVQSVTLGTSYVSGQVHLIAFRLVTELAVPTANVGYAGDEFSLGLPTVWDSSVLQLVYYPTATNVGTLTGSITYAQG